MISNVDAIVTSRIKMLTSSSFNKNTDFCVHLQLCNMGGVTCLPFMELNLVLEVPTVFYSYCRTVAQHVVEIPAVKQFKKKR